MNSVILSIKIYVADNAVAVMIGCATLVIGCALTTVLLPPLLELFGNRPATTPRRHFFHCPSASFIHSNHTLTHYYYTNRRAPVRQQINLIAADAAPFRNYHNSVLIDWANQTFRENGAVFRSTFSVVNPFIADLIDARFEQYPNNMPFHDRMGRALDDVRLDCLARDIAQLNLNHHAFDEIERYREEVSPDYRDYKANQRYFRELLR